MTDTGQSPAPRPGRAGQARAAMAAARARVAGEGRLVILAAAAVMAAFLMLAVLAPLALNAPGLLGTILAVLPFLLLLAGLGLALAALVRILRRGGGEAPALTGSLHPEALTAAWQDLEEAGLTAPGLRGWDDALSGRIEGRPVVLLAQGGRVHAVIRLADPVAVPVLLAPGAAAWPHALPPGPALTPLGPPEGVAALAWGGGDRDAARALLAALSAPLRLAAGGGAVPHLSLRGRALALSWTQGDIGGAALIVAAFAQALACEPGIGQKTPR